MLIGVSAGVNSFFVLFFGSFLPFCDAVLAQEVSRQEIQAPNHSGGMSQRLQQQEQDLQRIREALENELERGHPALLAEEELQQSQKWLDEERQERRYRHQISDEELQRRQNRLDDARQGRYPSYSDEELQQIKQSLEEAEQQMQKLSEERRRFDAALANKEYIEVLFQKGLAHRAQIKSGQMVITEHSKTREGEATREIAIAFDEQRRRVDRRNDFPNTSYEEIGCIGCYKKDNRLMLSYNGIFNKDELRKTNINIYDSVRLEEDELAKFWTQNFGLMPQYIACFRTVPLPTKETIEKGRRSLFGDTIDMLDTGAIEITITEEEYKGILCKKIVFDSEMLSLTSGKNVKRLNTLWIAVEQGYALRKQLYESESYDELFEVDVTLDKESGIWFPFAWHYERNDNGKTGTWQKGTVKNVILNKSIPESLFDMQDIKIIPAGVGVSWFSKLVPPPHGEQRVGALLWDGNDIVTRGMFVENLLASYAAENRSKRIITILFVNIAVISLFSGIYLLRYYRHLKQQN